MACVGCGKQAFRWIDDTTHPTILAMDDGLPCCYGPVDGWYYCQTRGELRPLTAEKMPTPSHWEAT